MSVLTFYYTWYASEAHDGTFAHWNHRVLDDSGHVFDAARGDIGSTFFPALGLYSSADAAVIDQHMHMMQSAGISVICTTWWGAESADENMKLDGFTDRVVPLLLDRAAAFGLTVCFHIEPYRGRSPTTVRKNIDYMSERYGQHPAFHRVADGRPLIFVYDSYLSPPDEWRAMISELRGSAFDSFLVALLVEPQHIHDAAAADFDALYSYFGADGFTFGSTPANWPAISSECARHGLTFIPCVAPGYDDRRIRPWNAKTTRFRDDRPFDGSAAAAHVVTQEGAYYDRFWRAAVALAPPMVAVTSFNEWHEGTQIEPARAAAGVYPGYVEPNFYLSATRKWVDELLRRRETTDATQQSLS